MAELFASGRVVDVILALMVGELALFVFFRGWAARRGDRGSVPLAPLVVNLAAGGALLGALRAALSRDAWPLIAVWLIVALGLHLADLVLRLGARGGHFMSGKGEV